MCSEGVINSLFGEKAACNFEVKDLFIYLCFLI